MGSFNNYTVFNLKSHEKLRLHFFLFMDEVAHPSYFGKHCTPRVNIKNIIQVGPSCSLQVYVNLCDFHRDIIRNAKKLFDRDIKQCVIPAFKYKF